jgi:hypothetical protein
MSGDINHIHDRGERVAGAWLKPGACHFGRPVDDADVDLAVLLVDDDLVGPFRQLDLLDEAQRLGVEDIDGFLLLVGTVVIEPVRVNRQIVGVWTAPDEANNLVGGWIDDVMDVAGVVALEDSHGNPRVRVESRNSLCGCRCGQENDTGEDAHGPALEWRRHFRPP